MDNRDAFLAALQAEPLDHLLRCIYADWLDDNGEVEEANRQRQWVPAYEFLLKHFIDPDEDEEGEPQVPGVTALLQRWHRSLIRDNGLCFGTETAVENVYDPALRPEFFRALEVVTGLTLPEEIRTKSSFRCAC